MDKAATDALDVLIPEPEVLKIAGEELRILPITLAQLGPLARACAEFGPYLASVLEDPQDTDLMELIGRDAEAYLQALSICSGKPVEWVGALGLDDGIRLARTVLKVNADFFSRAVRPQISALIADVAGLAGRMSSSDSSAQATAETTS